MDISELGVLYEQHKQNDGKFGNLIYRGIVNMNEFDDRLIKHINGELKHMRFVILPVELLKPEPFQSYTSLFVN